MKKISTYLVALVLLLCLVLPMSAIAIVMSEQDYHAMMEEVITTTASRYMKLYRGATILAGYIEVTAPWTDESDVYEATYDAFEVGDESTVDVTFTIAGNIYGVTGTYTITLDTIVPQAELPRLNAISTLTYGDEYTAAQEAIDVALDAQAPHFQVASINESGIIPWGTQAISVTLQKDSADPAWDNYSDPEGWTIDVPVDLQSKEIEFKVQVEGDLEFGETADSAVSVVPVGLVNENDNVTVDWFVYLNGYGGSEYTKDYALYAAGEYCVRIYAEENNGYKWNAVENAGQFTVKPAVLSLGADNGTSVTRTYNGEPREIGELQWSGMTNGSPVINVLYDGQSVAPVNVGEYDVTFKSANPNYVIEEGTYAELIIAPAEVTVELEAASAVYNGEEHKPVVAYKGLEEIVNGEQLKADIVVEWEDAEIKDVGTYQANISCSNDNIEVNETLTYEVQPAQLEVHANDWSSVVGDQNAWPYDSSAAKRPGSVFYIVGSIAEANTLTVTNSVSDDFPYDLYDLSSGNTFVITPSIEWGDVDENNYQVSYYTGVLTLKYADDPTTLQPTTPANKVNNVYYAQTPVTFAAAGYDVMADDEWQTEWTIGSEEGTVMKTGYWLRAADGKIHRVEETLTVVVDNEQPQIVLDYSEESAQNVNIDIKIEDNCGLDWYSVNGMRTEMSGELSAVTRNSATANGTLEIVVADLAGNFAPEKLIIDWLDNQAPTIDYEVDETVALVQNVEVTFTVTDQNDKGDDTSDTVKVYDQNDQEVVGSTIITENGTYNYRAEDAAGNVSAEVSVIVENIDNVAPVVTIGEPARVATNKPFSLTVAVQEENEYTLYWNKDGVAYEEVDLTNVLISENGSYSFYAEDEAGNRSDEVSISVDFIDQENPVLRTEIAPAFSNEKVVLTITANDNWSLNCGREYLGIAKIVVADESGAETEYVADGEDNVTCTYDITSNGTYTVTAYDIAGNSVTLSVPANCIDKDAPELTDNTLVGDATQLDVCITVLVTDEGVAQDNLTVTMPDGTINEVCSGESIEYTATANGDYLFKVKDAAGNESTKTIPVNCIDRQAPVVTISAVDKTATNADKKVYFRVEDTPWLDQDPDTAEVLTVQVVHDQSGEAMEVSEDGTYFIAKYNGTYTVTAVDAAGNEGTANSEAVETIFRGEVNDVSVSFNDKELTNADAIKVTISVAVPMDDGAKNEGDYDNYNAASVTLDGVSLDAEKGAVAGRWIFYGELTDNGDHTIEMTDKAGNTGAHTFDVGVFDREAPEATAEVEAKATNTTAKVTISAEDVLSKGQCNLPNELTHEITLPDGTTTTVADISNAVYEAPMNGTYTVKVWDAAGNEGTAEFTVDTIDKEIPELTGYALEPTDYTSGNATLNFSASDKASEGESDAYAKVDRIVVTGPNGFEKTLAGDATSLEVDTNGTYHITAFDIAGNEADNPFDVDVWQIDREAPEISLMSKDPAAITSGNVTLIFQATDGGSDNNGGEATNPQVARVEVQYNGGNPVQVDMTTYTYVAEKNGTYTVIAYDLANNPSETLTEVVDNIDRVDPTIECAQAEPIVATNGKVTINLEYDDKGEETEGAVTNTELVGVKDVTVSYNGGEEISIGTDVTAYDVDKNGTYVFTVYDNAGNNAEDEVLINCIDNQKPTLTFGETSEDPTYENVTINFTTGDTGNTGDEVTLGDYIKVADVEVKYGEGEWKSLGADAVSYVAEQNGDYYFRVTDLATNVSEVEYKYHVGNIDRIKPTFQEVDHKSADATREDVTVYFTVNDTGFDAEGGNATDEGKFGVKTVAVAHESDTAATTLEEGAESFVAAKNGIYTVTVTDEAGNSDNFTVEVYNIDRERPTFDWTGNESAEATNEEVVISFETNDIGKDEYGKETDDKFVGVDKLTVQKEGGEVIVLEKDATTYTVTENGKYYFMVSDKAGNTLEEPVMVEVDNIDNEAPTIVFGETSPVQNMATYETVIINFTPNDTGVDRNEGKTNAKFVGVKSIEVMHDSFSEPKMLDKDATTFEVEVNGVYTFTITDLANNPATFTKEITNIDHTLPTGDYTYAKNYRTSKNGVVITVNAGDMGADKLGLSAADSNYGVAKIEVVFNGEATELEWTGETNKSVVTSYTAKANGSYTFVITDLAGNTYSIPVEMTYIDDEAPEFTDVRITGNRLRFSVADNARLDRVEVKHVYAADETIYDVYGRKTAEREFGLTNAGYYMAVVYDEAGNSAEVRRLNVDSDDDGLSDQWETYVTHTDPSNPDCDGDGLTDGEESQHHTDHFKPDTDGDGLTDSQEVGLGLSPTSTDTDNDGVNDYVAVQLGMVGTNNELNAAVGMLLGDAYVTPGANTVTGAFASDEAVVAMMSGLNNNGLSAEALVGDMETNLLNARNALRRSACVLIQFNANTGDGLAVVNNYLVKFSRNKNTFNIIKAYDLSEMVEGETYIVLSNNDSSLALIAGWDESSKKTTSDMAVLSLVKDQAIVLNDTVGSANMAVSINGSSIAYMKDGTVTVLELASAQSLQSAVDGLVGLCYYGETPVAVLNNGQVWGLNGGEWKEMNLSSNGKVQLDLAQRTNSYRKVLLPGVNDTELELNVLVTVLMNQGDIAFKMGDMKRAVTMFDLSKLK